jgi:hypothetical protein
MDRPAGQICYEGNAGRKFHKRSLEALPSTLRSIFDPWEEQTISFRPLTSRQAADDALAGGFNPEGTAPDEPSRMIGAFSS